MNKLLLKINFFFKIFARYLLKKFIYAYKSNREQNKITNLYKELSTKNKYLALINTTSIGSLSSQINYYYKYANSKNLDIKDSFIFLAKKENICNKFFVNNLKKRLSIKFDDELYDLIMLKEGLKFFLERNLVIEFKNDFVNYMPNINFPFEFSKREIFKAEKLLAKLKIKKKKKLVGIAYKDNTYWNLRKIKKPWDYYRHSSAYNLIESIQYLKKRGYQCVLLGDNSEDNLLNKTEIIKLNGLSKSERELLDIYIYSKMEFAIIGALGLKFLAEMFRVPILSHNGLLPQWQSNGIFLPKKYVDSITKKIIPLNDLLKRKIVCLDFDEGKIQLVFKEPLIFRDINEFKICSIDLIENTSSEILKATKEMIELIMNNKKLSKKEINMQQQIRSIFFNNKIFTRSVVNYGVNFGGYFSPSFLKANKTYFD